GGIRRGSDVVKAVALGARAAMIGRAYLWGLAANGQAGVENVLDILRNGIDSALLGLGRSSVSELTPSDVLVPAGFVRTLGAPPEMGPTWVRRGEPGGSIRCRGPRWRRSGPVRSWPYRSGRRSSTGPTCRWVPIPTSPSPWPTGSPRLAPTSSSLPRSPTAPPANTPPSPAPCRSAPPHWSSSSWSRSAP